MVYKIKINKFKRFLIKHFAKETEDVYKIVGIKFSDTSIIKDVSQMRINPQTYEDIQKILIHNAKRNKRYRCYVKEYAQRAIRFEWVNYSPTNNDNIPIWEIWYVNNIEDWNEIK